MKVRPDAFDRMSDPARPTLEDTYRTIFVELRDGHGDGAGCTFVRLVQELFLAGRVGRQRWPELIRTESCSAGASTRSIADFRDALDQLEYQVENSGRSRSSSTTAMSFGHGAVTTKS